MFHDIHNTNSSSMRQSLNKEKKVRPLTKSHFALTRNVIYLLVGKSLKVIMSIQSWKKRLKDEKLEEGYPEVHSDFSLEVVDKTFVNMFEDW